MTGAPDALLVGRPLPNPFGSGRLTQLTQSARPTIHSYFDLCPWSPDGSLIVVSTLGAPGEPASIVVLDTAERRSRVIGSSTAWTSHAGAFQQWLPGTRQVAFMDAEHGEDVVRVVDIDDGSERTLQGRLRMFSPDGSLALSHSDAREGWSADRDATGMFLTSIATGERQLIVSVADMLRAHPSAGDIAGKRLGVKHGKWSPDGEHFFFVLSNEFGQGEAPVKVLYCARRDGSAVRVLVDSVGWGHPSWHPDSTRVLANVTVATGQRRLCEVDIASGTVAPITDVIVGTGHPSFDPSGRFIVLERLVPEEAVSGTVEIFVLDTANDSLTRVGGCAARDHTHAGTHEHPTWSRDGRRLLFNSDQSGHAEVYELEVERD